MTDPDRRRLEGLVALFGVQFLFGLFPLFVHQATDTDGGFAPRALLVWRIGVGALVFLAVAAWRHPRELRVPLRELGWLWLASLLGITLNMFGALEGVARTSVVHAGLLFTLIPVFTYGIALLARQEGFSAWRAAGIAVALSGAALLVLRRSADTGPLDAPVLGNVLIVLNSLSYAAYLVLARRLLARRPTLVVIAWLFVLAVPTLPLIALGTPLVPEVLTREAWGGMVGTVLVTTVLAYLVNTYALARVSASTTAAFVYLQPLIVGATGMLFRGERPHATAFVAAALLFLGLGLVLRRRAPAPVPQPAD